jgi:peptide/nickel transport system substrate-binding protein
LATQRNRPIVPLLVVALAVAAAGWWFVVRPRTGGPAPAPATSTATAPARGGELVASFRSRFTTYNRYVDPTASGDLLAFLTEAALVRVDRRADRLEPWLAESWTESADGLTYTLTLRQGVTFSDGAPFTSADVVFSFKAISDPRTQPPALSDSILVSGKPLVVEAPDPRTVVVRFPERFAPGLRLIDSVPMLPKHKLEAALAAGTFSQAWGASTPPQELAGLGPFVVTEHLPGERLVLARNPHYWRTDASGVQLPYLDTLTVLVIPDQNTEALRMEAGDVDLMSNGDIRPDDYGAFKRVADQGRLRLIEPGFLSTDPNLLWFNLAPARASDPRNRWLRSAALRQAISCAVDRQAIVNAVFLGAAVPIYGPISPANTAWYTPPVNPCVHDLARAKQLLATTGLTDRNGDGMLEDGAGRPAQFSIITQAGHTIRERTTSMLQAQLREVGLKVDVVSLEPGGLQKRWGTQDYDAIYYGVQSGATDPALNMQFWLSSGYLHFWNPGQAKPASDWERQIDALFTRQAATADLGERQRLFAEVERIYSEQMPAIYFVAPKTIIAVSSRVANPTPAPQIPQLLWSVDTLASTARRR